MSYDPDEKNNKRCFVISPIGEAGSSTRKHMDMVFNSIIIPAFEDLDFEKPYRSDHDDDPGLITDKMIESIATDKLVIAVLTDLNPNVFYEVGIAHAIGKDVILITQSHDDIPFDINYIKYIHYLPNNEGYQKLVKDISARMRTIIGI